MISQVALMPEEKLGVVVLTNSETPLSTILAKKVFDLFLGVRARDWNSEFLALSAYTGTYSGEMFGDAKVY